MADAEISGISGAKVSGAVASSSALAANPADCSAGQYATTIAANGDLTCAQVAFSQVSGTVTNGNRELLQRGGRVRREHVGVDVERERGADVHAARVLEPHRLRVDRSRRDRRLRSSGERRRDRNRREHDRDEDAPLVLERDDLEAPLRQRDPDLLVRHRSELRRKRIGERRRGLDRSHRRRRLLPKS